MTKQEWISHKIKILINEGRPKDQAAAIAYSMWEKGDHKQQGGTLPEYQFGGFSSFNPQPLAPVPQAYTPQTNPLTANQYANFSQQLEEKYPINPQIPQSLDLKNQYSKENVTKYASENLASATPAEPDQQYNDWTKYNIVNPYGQGMDLNTSLAYTGQQFGQGNKSMGVAGAGLSLLKGARSFLSGYGAGKGQKNVEDQLHDNLYNNDTNLYSRGVAQQGGQLPYHQELGVVEGEDDLINKYPNMGRSLYEAPYKPSINWDDYEDDLSTNVSQYYRADPITGNSIAQKLKAKPTEATQTAQTDDFLGGASPTATSPEGTPYQSDPNWIPTTVEKSDPKSARDAWEDKTGLPWSEAKRRGYTDGSAKDNTKLLEELNDPRFKSENIRSKPFTSPTQQRQQVKEVVQAAQAAQPAVQANPWTGQDAKALLDFMNLSRQANKGTAPSAIPDNRVSPTPRYDWNEDRHKDDYKDKRTKWEKARAAINNQGRTFGLQMAFQEGGYAAGQEYDLEDEEIQKLVKQGYKVRYV